MNVSVIWVQKLWARYRHVSHITYPKQMGRPKNGVYGRREHSAVIYGYGLRVGGAGSIRTHVSKDIGMNIPHHNIHKILTDERLASKDKKKSGQRKWVRYERKYSNSLWHTDYKLLPNKKWFISYLDDASRYILAHGVFDEATTQHAIDVLHEAISKHGVPASVMTDHGSQFYANEKENRIRGVSKFEEELVRLGINHILSGVRHPQTNGKIERFHGEIHRKIHVFEDASAERTIRNLTDDSHIGGPLNTTPRKDAVTRFIEWYNNIRTHMSLNDMETPAQAYRRKMPPIGETVTDEESGEQYHVS